MIARVWHGAVPAEKAEGYARYLSDSDLGIRGYQAVRGNRGVTLLRRSEGDRVHFLLVSLWDSPQALRDYAGPDIERAQYFEYDKECLLDPEPNVTHYEVLAASGRGATPDGTLAPPV